MLHFKRQSCTRRWSALAAVVAAAALLCPMSVLAADTTPTVAGSASLVPETAAFYAAMLRNREQLQAMLHSNAWAKLRSLPAVQQLVAKGMAEAVKNGGAAKAMAFFSQPENRQLMRVLHEMGSDEIFFYGGRSWIDTITLLSQFNSVPTQLAMMGQNPNSKVMQQVIVRALIKNRAHLRIPTLVIGFKIDTAKDANEQISRLEKILDQVISQNPMLQGRLKR
jgi:hypothetical protein